MSSWLSVKRLVLRPNRNEMNQKSDNESKGRSEAAEPSYMFWQKLGYDICTWILRYDICTKLKVGLIP